MHHWGHTVEDEDEASTHTEQEVAAISPVLAAGTDDRHTLQCTAQLFPFSQKATSLPCCGIKLATSTRRSLLYGRYMLISGTAGCHT